VGQSYTTIGLDFGGVIATHLPIKCAILQQRWGIDVSPTCATRSYLIPRIGQQLYDELEAELHERLFEFTMHEHVREVLERLSQNNFRFVVISMQEIITQQQLKQYFSHYDIPITETHVVTHNNKKMDVCKTRRVQLYCDDRTPILSMLEPLGIILVWADLNGFPAECEGSYHKVNNWLQFEVFLQNSFQK